MSDHGKRLTKPQLEQIMLRMLPSYVDKRDKHELADMRANFAEWLYNNSEPNDQLKPRHVLD